jgi:hypothetical protein
MGRMMAPVRAAVNVGRRQRGRLAGGPRPHPGGGRQPRATLVVAGALPPAVRAPFDDHDAFAPRLAEDAGRAVP